MAETFTVGQLARAAGMTIEEVRSHFDRGLLPPPRRMRGRSGDTAFHREHLDRLLFINRSLACGFTLADISELVDPGALRTCGDVFALTERRLVQIRESGQPESPAAAHLAALRDACPGRGARQDCTILKALSSPGC